MLIDESADAVRSSGRATGPPEAVMLVFRRVDFGSAAPRPAFEEMTVAEQARAGAERSSTLRRIYGPWRPQSFARRQPAWGLKEPLTRPVPAGESAVAGHPLPRERADVPISAPVSNCPLPTARCQLVSRWAADLGKPRACESSPNPGPLLVHDVPEPNPREADYSSMCQRTIVSEWPTIWTQLREAAGGRSERGAIQGNRAS